MSVIPMEIDGDDVAHNLGINPSTLLIIKAPFSAICTIVRKAQPLGYDPSSIEDDQRSAMGQGLNIFFNAVASVVEEINLDPDSLHTRFWNRMFKDGKRRKRLVKDTQLLAMVYANKDWLAVVAEAYPVTSPVIREGTFIPAEGIHNQLRKAFDCDYKGSTASNLCRTLEEHYKTKYDPKFDYGRIIAITNSSATGKSRAVHELSKSIPLVSICFRADDEPTSGWPPRDIPAVRFFSDGLPGDFRGEEMAAVFYAAFLTVVTQSLKGKVAPVDPVELMSEWALPSDWYQFVSASNSRHAHFEKLFDVRKQILHDTYSRIKDIRSSNASSAESLFIWYRQLYLDVVHDRRKALAEELRRLGYETFIIAFDEANYLNHVTGFRASPIVAQSSIQLPECRMSVIALQHIIKSGDEYDAELDGFTFWHFLIDTSSIIFDLAPQGKPAPSYRLSNELYRPLAVWPFISFDDMISDKPPLQHPGDAHLLANLKYYGRPYWATLPTELLPAEAQRKLFRSWDVQQLQDTEQDIFAAFSQRILLELAHNNEASTHLALEAVKSRMRLLIDVVNDVAITRAPSEPMLAIAAAQQMNANVAAYDEAVKTLLNKLVLEGTVVDTGLMGELSYRLLLTIARDFATLPRDVDSPLVDEFVRVTHGPGDKLTKAVRPVTLWNLLTTLVGERLGLGCQTDQVQSSTFDDLKKWASHVWLNFTHFKQVDEHISCITTEELAELWSRTAAVQCSFKQPVMDGFMVGYYCEGEDKLATEDFRHENLIIIPLQIKARVKISLSPNANTLVCPFIRLPNGHTYKPLHLAIFMDLVTEASFRSGGQAKLTKEKAVSGTGRKKYEWAGHSPIPEHEAERFCLNIRGHGSEQYPIIARYESAFQKFLKRSLRLDGLRDFRQQWEMKFR